MKNTDLQAHHLIEKRFAAALGQDPKDMLSVAVTRTEHQSFTNAWRGEIGYGARTAGASRATVEAAATRIYQGYPSILRALRL